MSRHWRQQLDWLHGWAGLLAGWALYFVFITGTLGYLDSEIDRWMQPELPPPQQTPVITQLRLADAYLQQHAAGMAQWRIFTAIDRNQPWLKVQWRDGRQGRYQTRLLSQESGEALHGRLTAGGRALYRLHYRFHYIPAPVARWLISFLTAVLVLVLLSGIVIHRHLLRDWFTFRAGKGLRTGLDLHLLAGVAVLPFLLMISYSGLLFYLPTQFPGFAATEPVTGAQSLQRILAPSAPASEADRTGVPMDLTLVEIVQAAGHEIAPQQIRRVDLYRQQGVIRQLVIHPRTQLFQRQEKALRVQVESTGPEYPSYTGHGPVRAVYESVLGLHEGNFAPAGLRAGYLLSGVSGGLAIMTGLLIWETKRLRRLSGTLGYRLVSGLNLGVIAGLPWAIAVYFIGNRVLPADLPQRAAAELNLLFVSWLLFIVLALLRPGRPGWLLFTALAGGSYLILPCLSLLCTDRNLYLSYQLQDWWFWGFELAAIGIGCALLSTSCYLYRRGRTA